MLNILGGRVRDVEAERHQDKERRAYCCHCRRTTEQGRSNLTGLWYCLKCGQRQEG